MYEGFRMKLRRVIAFMLAMFLYVQPATVNATQWGPVSYFFKYWPPGIPEAASACGQAAIYDVALNWQLAFVRKWINQSCNGIDFGVPAGDLGVRTYGYKDGALCGQTGTSYNTYTSDSWAISAYLCSNPSGSQSFYSRGVAIFFRGYWDEWWCVSPVEHY